MTKPTKTRIISIAWLSATAMFFIADRWLKHLAIDKADEPSLHLIGDFFIFDFTKNPYISFSLPLSGWWLNLVLGVVIIVLIFYIIYLISNKNSQRLLILPLTFILFGAISNIIDRIQYGYVVDYLEMRYFSVFNLADAMISLGALGTILCCLKERK